MKFLFYLGHPAHFHNISKVLPRLIEQDHKIIIYARGKDVLFDLIKDLQLKIYKTNIVDKYSDKINIIIGTLKREIQLFGICLKEKPDLMVGTDIVITHVGKLLNIPSIILNEDDAKAVPLLAKLGFKYSTYTLSPDCCNIEPYNHKKISYPSYHEFGYLHHNHFEPNREIVDKYLKSQEDYFILRFSNLKAHHDTGIKGISDIQAIKLVSYLEKYGKVFISSERTIPSVLLKNKIQIPPIYMHHILAFAKIYIGDSQTMAAEAGILGTPFIRYNDFVGRLGYLDELEDKYKLGFGVKPPNFDLLFKRINEILTNNVKEQWNKKKEILLRDKIDYSKFLFWFLNNFPESNSLMKANNFNFNIFK